MRLNIFIWLIVLALLWGPSYLFVKVAVQEIPPLTLVTARVSLAAIFLIFVLRTQHRNLPKFGSIWKHFAVMGLVYNALPFVLLSWGQQYIDSALAAILIGTSPLFTMILAHLFTADDHFTSARIVGVLAGFGGLVLLFIPILFNGLQANLWGLLAATGAAASYGVAFFYGRQYLRGLPALVGPTTQLTAATVYLVPLAVVIEHPYTLPMPSWPAFSSLLMLTILSTVLAFVVYYWVMEQTSATTLSLVTYLIPIVATILGVVVLNERLEWNAYLGCSLIILGVIMANGGFKLVSWRRLTSAGIRP